MKTIMIVSVVLLTIALPAFSQDSDSRAHICFRTLDTDRDGQVTAEEFKRFYPDGEQLFGEADANRDGALTHDEYHALLGHGAR